MIGSQGFLPFSTGRRLYSSDVGAMFGGEPGRTLARGLLFLPDGPDFVAPSTTATSVTTASGSGSYASPAPDTTALSVTSATGVGAYASPAPPASVESTSIAFGFGLYAAVAPSLSVESTSVVTGVGSSAAPPVNIAAPARTIESTGLAYAERVGNRLKATLVGKLAPKISRLKATIHLKIGDRPYRVFLVRKTWGGSEPGRGTPSYERVELGCGVDKKTGLIMPPELTYQSPHARPRFRTERRGLVASAGDTDTVYVTDIDPSMTERDIVRFADLGPNGEEYIEVEQYGTSGGNSNKHPIRRYRIAGTPTFDSENLSWTLPIQPQDPQKATGS